MPIISGSSGSGGGGKIPAAQIGSSPPSNPSDGMLWIFPADATNGVDWLFVYNSAETTYKWRFIGGPPMTAAGNPNAVLNTLTQVGATGCWYSAGVSVARAGDYFIAGSVDFGYPSNTTANQVIAINPFAGSAIASDTRRNDAAWWTNSATPHNGTHTSGVMTGISASTTVGIAASSGDSAHIALFAYSTYVIPVRVI